MLSLTVRLRIRPLAGCLEGDRELLPAFTDPG